MALPKYLHQRGDAYYVRRPLPLDVQPAYGRKEIWRSLHTTSRREAEAKSHAVLAELEREIEAKRRELRAADKERAFLASPHFDAALREHGAVANRIMTGGMPYARHPETSAEAAFISQQIGAGALQRRPAARADAIAANDSDLAELESERAHASLVTAVDEDGEPFFGSIPERHVPALMARLNELIEADKRTLEAQRTIIAGTLPEPPEADSDQQGSGTLADLRALWGAHRKPSARSGLEARTAVARFERINGPLPYAGVTDEHARRFKADLLGDPGLKNRTREKLWGMLRTMFNVAIDDGLLDANPFTKIKLKLDDDSTPREVLTRDDLVAIFGKLSGEDWWIARIALYTGARIGEVCQLTQADVQVIGGVHFLHIREDAEGGKSVKTRSSIRKVPLHRQLIADGLLEWIKARKTEALFSGTSAAASKRLNLRMRKAGLGKDEPFHSLRHTFKGVARRHMDMEWHDRLTGHASKSVGQRYGDYDLRTLKEKIDLITFGIETALPSIPGGSPQE